MLAVPSSGPHQYGAPVFLAEVRKPGLASYLAQNMHGGKNSLTISLDERRVIASPEAREVEAVSQSIANPALAGFSQTPFYNRIAQSYSVGAGYLFAADMEQMIAKSVTTPKEVPPDSTMLNIWCSKSGPSGLEMPRPGCPCRLPAVVKVSRPGLARLDLWGHSISFRPMRISQLPS